MPCNLVYVSVTASLDIVSSGLTSLKVKEVSAMPPTGLNTWRFEVKCLPQSPPLFFYFTNT
jgi:hypothetical protein